MDTQQLFPVVQSSAASRGLLPRAPEEYAGKVGEMKCALIALAAVFHQTGYEIRAGVPSEGQSAGFKTVEGTVSLDWGIDVPGRFKVRAYVETDADETPIINGICQAVSRVFSFCLDRAVEPHVDQLQRLLAIIIELRTLMDQLRAGHHIEATFAPFNGGANIEVLCWIDGMQFEERGNLQDDRVLRELSENLVTFVMNRITAMLTEQNEKRMPQEAVVIPVQVDPEEPD